MKSKLMLALLLLSLILSQQVIASEKDVYEFSWLDPDKEVYVLQNRKFRKEGHLYFNLGAGITTSGAFVDSSAVQGRVGFFVSENFGFEILYSKNIGKENDTAKAVRGATPFRRIIDSYNGAMILWSPFYSKINTFNSIVYMDWIFGLGLTQIKEKNNKLAFENSMLKDQETLESHTGLLWEAGLKFYLDPCFSIRTDLTAFHYNAKNIAIAGSTLKSNYDATMSLGYTF